MSEISRRKSDHLDLAAHGDVGHLRSNLLECVELLHCALPELAFDQVVTEVMAFKRKLRAPLLIAGMTGGNARGQEVNRQLAELAEELGYGFGLGSQRPMLLDPSCARTYKVRDLAPSTLILGNLGAVQAAALPLDQIDWLVGEVDADGLCLHLNPAMELVQSEGDRDFRGVLDAIGRIAEHLKIPLIVKETGCGLSPAVARLLARANVRHVDVSGAGGTSWVAVETERQPSESRRLGSVFREWGIPSAASVMFCARQGFDTIIATGGIESGLDAARAIALGASLAGIARPVLKALERGGKDEARRYLSLVRAELRTAMLLTGAKSVANLSTVPRILRGPLVEWMGGLRDEHEDPAARSGESAPG